MLALAKQISSVDVGIIVQRRPRKLSMALVIQCLSIHGPSGYDYTIKDIILILLCVTSCCVSSTTLIYNYIIYDFLFHIDSFLSTTKVVETLSRKIWAHD